MTYELSLCLEWPCSEHSLFYINRIEEAEVENGVMSTLQRERTVTVRMPVREMLRINGVGENLKVAMSVLLTVSEYSQEVELKTLIFNTTQNVGYNLDTIQFDIDDRVLQGNSIDNKWMVSIGLRIRIIECKDCENVLVI